MTLGHWALFTAGVALMLTAIWLDDVQGRLLAWSGGAIATAGLIALQ